MPLPFNSARFFNNPFFTQTATIGSASVPVIVRERPAPDDGGTLQTKAGRWADVSLMARHVSTAPVVHTTITVGSDVWRVVSVANFGDVYKCLCIEGERKR